MTDLISREAAIEALEGVLDRVVQAIADMKPMDAASALFLMNKALSSLPSVERDK